MLAYALNSQKGIMLRFDYAHQTGDVPYGNINASTEWQTDHLYLTGNPNLRPWKQDRLMLALSMFNNKLTLISGYNNGKGFSTYITEEGAFQPGIYVTHPVNTENHDVTLLLGASLNLNPLKFWRVNLSTSVSWDKLNNAVGGIYYEGWKNRWQVSTSQNFVTLTYNFSRGKSVSHQQANSIISVNSDTRNR